MYGRKILVVKGEEPKDISPVKDENTVDSFLPEELDFDPKDWENDDDIDEGQKWAQWLGERYGEGYYRVFQPYGVPNMYSYFQGEVKQDEPKRKRRRW